MSRNLGLFYLSRQNLRRKLFRSLVTIIAVGIVAATLFPTTILGEGVSKSLSQGSARLGADLMVAPPGYTNKLASTLISGEPSTFTMDGSIEGQVKQIPGVQQVSPQLYFATLASG
jgi:putative ABC transport system permease protein